MPSAISGLPGLPLETNLRVLKIQREEMESARSNTVWVKLGALFFRTTKEDALEQNEAATVRLVNSLPGAKPKSKERAAKQVTFG